MECDYGRSGSARQPVRRSVGGESTQGVWPSAPPAGGATETRGCRLRFARPWPAHTNGLFVAMPSSWKNVRATAGSWHRLTRVNLEDESKNCSDPCDRC